ncbi:hypothetical protein F7018_02135 [Tenacibaculum aiptasiae]|uniref:Uncharacterized protein n=1 Tax=Tenacibaculum aiptasiae TaxID=426481 RepID=A0A7J5AST5_9FLAO|nr:hypothetical protein [Tenacibaculum aiptasiae]KAB1160697.1 hypothetical protein F7018_02135 [Tenacibaculum aiptasiae]
MSKKKFKLDLNKEIISDLQASKINGGGPTVLKPIDRTYGSMCRMSFEGVCTWSEGTDDLGNR